jgi:hypothetical protein
MCGRLVLIIDAFQDEEGNRFCSHDCKETYWAPMPAQENRLGKHEYGLE